ncbi:MAG: hypothetical protein K1X55_04460 [Chitinophagales bacterium]|nr:hypothetical protein [Chitinophagales bacterium]
MKRVLLYVFLSLFIISSCKKESIPSPEKVGSSSAKVAVPSVKNGRLVFASNDALLGYIRGLQKMSNKEILALNTSARFVSHYDVMNNIPPTEGYTEAQLSEANEIYDMYFANALNKDREVQISNYIYQAGNDYNFLFFEADKPLIDQFRREVATGTISLKEGQYIIYKEKILCHKTVWSCDLYNRISSEYSGEKVVDATDNFNNTKRMKSKFWETNWLVYASNGAETKTQKKECAWFICIWNALSSTTVEVKYNVNFASCMYGGQPCFLAATQNITGTKTKSNDNNASQIFFNTTGQIGITTNGTGSGTSPTGSGASLPMLVWNGKTDHKAVWNGNTKTKSLTW